MTIPQVRSASDDSDADEVVRAGSARLLHRVLSGTPALLDGPNSQLRRAVLDVAMQGLAAADPGPATRRAVRYDADRDVLSVEGREYPLRKHGRVFVVGAGKASYPIAVALADVLGPRLAGGVVAVRDPDASAVPPLDVLCADHPLPTGRSVAAATQILAVAAAATRDDIVIACFTGGSSALSSLPPPGVTPDDKRRLHQQLLSSGLPITDINTVRKQVSHVKGGRVALAALPATVINLTVSDVAGSPLDAVTDPTVADTSTAAGARAVLRGAGIWDAVPPAVRTHLERDVATPIVGAPAQTVMLADGAATVAAMAAAAQHLGCQPVVMDELEGDADDVGVMLAHRAVDEARARGRGVMLLGCGGESVVTVTSRSGFGKGGPNQQAALRAAEVLDGLSAAALFIDTDGSDGGTAYAGALVDGATARRAAELGVDLAQARRRQHSTQACEQLDITIQTGHTGTNVNDLFVVLSEPEVSG